MQADYRNLRPQLDGYGVVVADCRTKAIRAELVHLTSKVLHTLHCQHNPANF